MSKTIIVALKINALDLGFQDFLKLTGAEKLDLFEKRLMALCKQLAVSHLKDKWILAWREDSFSTIFTADLKKEFKSRMSKLAQLHPNLTIISGTILSIKKAPLAKAKEVLKYYEHSLWLEKMEEQEIKQEVRSHREKVAKLAEMKSNPDCKIDIVRNTCYIFEGDTIRRFDKMAPFSEVGFEKEYSIFKPGGKKGKNMEHFFTLSGPDDTKLNISLEICREHAVGWVKHVKVPSQKVSIHFILSSFTPTILSNIVGDYVIHLDSLEYPKIIKIRDNKETKEEVLLYTNNLFDNNAELAEIKPDATFKTLLLKEVDSLLKKMPEKSCLMLNELKNKISKEVISDQYYIDKNAYSYFKDKIRKIKPILINEKKETLKNLQNLSMLLNNRYVVSQFITNNVLIPAVRSKIISRLKQYISSQSGLFSMILHNQALVAEKIKLAEAFIKQIQEAPHSVTSVVELILNFKEQALACDERFNTVYRIIKNDFQSCLDSIEEDLLPEASSDVEDHIVKIAR